ncbi:MAG: hypothetical protein M3N13_10115 [Candidatus Eremiobacteraeota bacterium]|nr:hypothetical protein [Candidatus Eremiobacteraeota bacterium]
MFVLALALVAPSPAGANTQSHIRCIDLGGRVGPLSHSEMVTMATVCERAAHEHERAARGLSGAGRQEQELNEAAALYFAALGQIGTGHIRQGVNSLARSTSLMINVRDHGATSDLRDRARSGVQAVDSTINALGNMK